MNPAISALLHDAFVEELGFSLPTGAMHAKLGAVEPVRALRKAYIEGSISSDEIRDIVAELLAGFVRGRRLPKEEVLAGIIVALSTVYDEFAGELIESFSRIQASELPLAPRIARFSKQLRARQTQNTKRKDEFRVENVPFKVFLLSSSKLVDTTEDREVLVA
jgi:hypothetical protein